MAKSVVGLVGLALLGALFGQAVAPAKAVACECSPAQWRLELAAVTSSDATVDHTAYWPAAGLLLTYTGYASVSANSPSESGVISRATAQDFSR